MKVTKKYHQISAYDGKPGLEPIYVHRLDLWSPPPVPLPIPFPSPILASFHTMDELEIRIRFLILVRIFPFLS